MEILKRDVKKSYHIFSTLIFIVLVIFIISRTAKVVERKDSRYKYEPFFEQEENFDVLFLGTSHVMDGVFPMELWNDYGIVSYNLGGNGNYLPLSYWVMENALDYTSPELVVIDVFFMEEDAKIRQAEQAHLSLDSFAVTPTKVKTILDLFDDKESEYYAGRWEFLWDFGIYHDRWNTLSEEDFVKRQTKEKGAESRIAVAVPREYTIISKEQKLNKDSTGKRYLCKMIEDCQKRGIKVVLTNLPYPASEEEQMASNDAYDIAEEYGVDFIDFVQMDNVVNYQTDLYDYFSHLNPSGARKVTAYLGQYLREYYNIPDQRSTEAYESWKDDYEEYTRYKLDTIREQEQLDNALMLLADKGLSCCIYIKEEAGVYQDQHMRALIQNLCQYQKPSEINEAIETGEDYFLIVDNSWNRIWEISGERALEDAGTTFGSVNYGKDEQNKPFLYLQGDDNNILESDPDLCMVVIDKYTGCVEDVAMLMPGRTENFVLTRGGEE